MAAKKPVPGEPSWYWRRIVLFIVCTWCMVMLWRLVGAEDSEVNEALVSGLVMLLGALMLGYQGFATVQDVAAIMATRSGTPYVAPPAPAEPPAAEASVEAPIDPYYEQRAPGAGIRW